MNASMNAAAPRTPLVTLTDVGVHLTPHAGGAPQTLVEGVNFSVSPGERVGLIGESGSGKSLTSLAIPALLPPGLHTSGRVVLDGVDTVRAPDAHLRKLRGRVTGMVFQEPRTALDPLMRVGRQVAEPMRRHLGLRGVPLRDAVLAALAEVKLTDARIARAFPHELSGGQRQRIALAIALAGQPKLLIADEPTTALDVTVQEEVLQLLDRLVQEREMGLLFVSHDLAVVSRMTDRVLVLRTGIVVEEGRAEQILRDPQHPYTQQLVFHARALDAALDGHLAAAASEQPRDEGASE